MDLADLAQDLHAWERVDVSDFQRRARILQSLWREEHGFVCGEYRGRLLGSRLAMPWAQEALANFITSGIREVVLGEVCDRNRSAGKLYAKPRIFEDLLNSQPLCFNLFAELRLDLSALSATVNDITDGRFPVVRAIEFEFSPGRGDSQYTSDHSAFDVFLECGTPSGNSGFIGIEVKYHENLLGPASSHKGRYDDVAAAMGCFSPEWSEALRRKPLQQIWRDHLLAGATRMASRYHDGMFAVLFPAQNKHVARALDAYADCLSDTRSFGCWTLEAFVERLRAHSSAEWIGLFEDRYLAFEKIKRRLEPHGTQKPIMAVHQLASSQAARGDLFPHQ
jgi:hypothetical protein